ncbi:MAG: response regulator [Hyphomicrobium sp.]|jgi:DNA-binding response OmpR family regulator|nr:response regulator [Hyphomicrobium sp.]
MRVLIVEDEFLIAQMVAELLTDAGHTVVGIAGSVDKAIEKIEQHDIDVAIVDANLKGLCADDVGVELREHGIPFVVTTGYSQRQLRGALVGAPFLKKPIVGSDLLASIDALPRKNEAR